MRRIISRVPPSCTSYSWNQGTRLQGRALSALTNQSSRSQDRAEGGCGLVAPSLNHSTFHRAWGVSCRARAQPAAVPATLTRLGRAIRLRIGRRSPHHRLVASRQSIARRRQRGCTAWGHQSIREGEPGREAQGSLALDAARRGRARNRRRAALHALCALSCLATYRSAPRAVASASFSFSQSSENGLYSCRTR